MMVMLSTVQTKIPALLVQFPPSGGGDGDGGDRDGGDGDGGDGDSGDGRPF